MFKLGMLNNHISGIDLTFEHYNESLGCVCRASALIRKFKIEDSDSLEINGLLCTFIKIIVMFRLQ